MENKECYIDRHNEEKIEFGLDKIYKLLKVMGCPQDKLNVIHIAGTNGKGSVSNYLMHILAYAGYKVGKISSPVIFSKMEFAQIGALEKVNTDEKFKPDDTINHEIYVRVNDADERRFNELANLYKSDMESIKTSGYENQIALSLRYFLEEECDIVIVETGMGGSLDATNVFDKTLCDVLTSISADHIGMIGNNLEEITMCKCGIITKNGNVVTTSTNNDVMSIIKDNCKKASSTLSVVDMSEVQDVVLNIDNNLFVYGDKKYSVSLNGRHQIENASIALKVIDVLRNKGYVITEEALSMGLKETKEKGRCDILYRTDRTMLVADGAHNESGAKCLVRSIEDYIDKKNSRIIYVLSIFKDKEYKSIINSILCNADEIWTFETTNPRCFKSDELYNIVQDMLIDKKDTASYNNVVLDNIITIDNIKKKIEELDNVNNKCKKDNLDTKLDYRQNVIICAGSLSFMKEIYTKLV